MGVPPCERTKRGVFFDFDSTMWLSRLKLLLRVDEIAFGDIRKIT